MQTIEQAILNAEASLRMEGLFASEDARRDCKHVFNGKMTREQYLSNVYKRYGVNKEAEDGELQS
jgi:hypothetical protein